MSVKTREMGQFKKQICAFIVETITNKKMEEAEEATRLNGKSASK